MFLGLLLATLIHALLEIPTLAYITNNLEVHGQGYLWQNWKMIHGVVGAGLWFGGLIFGFWAGKKWWQILYVEKRYGKPRF